MQKAHMMNKEKQGKISVVKGMLHGEGLILLAAALGAYAWMGFNGWVLLAAFFAPDLVFVLWAVDKRLGTVAYNIVHSLMLPVALLAAAVILGIEPGIQAALIWLAHIGMDRAVGYGLKYLTDFKDTHLGRV